MYAAVALVLASFGASPEPVPDGAARASGGLIGIRLEESGEIAYEDATAIVRGLSAAVEAACGAPTAVDDPVWSTCSREERCVEQVRARTHAEQVVLVRIYGSLTLARVVGELFSSPGAALRRAEADLPLGPKATNPPRREALERLARGLCPVGQGSIDLSKRPGSRPEATPALVPKDRPEPRVLPWIVVGASVVAGGAGVFFGVSSSDARASAERPDVTDAEFEVLADRAQGQAIAANFLFAAAGAGLIAGALLWLDE